MILACSVDMEEFLDAASSRLPTLRGIKYSSTDLHQLGRCVVHSGGRYSMLYGCDQVRYLVCSSCIKTRYLRRSYQYIALTLALASLCIKDTFVELFPL